MSGKIKIVRVLSNPTGKRKRKVARRRKAAPARRGRVRRVKKSAGRRTKFLVQAIAARGNRFSYLGAGGRFVSGRAKATRFDSDGAAADAMNACQNRGAPARFFALQVVTA